MKKTITLVFSCFIQLTFAQTQFWSDTFEDSGAPSSGTRTPENNSGSGGPPLTSYFVRTDNSGISLISGNYTGFEGSKFWAGEDHDTPFSAGNEEQQIDFTGINISGKTGLSFRGLFAANATNAAFESIAFGFSHDDYIIVQYRIDAGAYTDLIRFYANNGTGSGANNKSLAEETTGDNIGEGTIITSAFAEFTKSISGTGTTLDIRIKAYTNGGNEELAFDNFRVYETVCAAPSITGNPANVTLCPATATTFTVSGTGTSLTYQWRRNGSNLSNTGVYSSVTTATLSVSDGTGLSGSTFDCVVSGACNPTATSTTATLTLNSAPSVTGHPANVTLCPATATTFTVSATGTSITYQWRRNGSNLSNTGVYSSVTTATLSVSDGTGLSGSTFDCVVSGTCTPTATSNTATLTLNSAPSVTGHPANVTLCPATATTFTVSATGTSVTYQWRRNGSNLSNTGVYSSVTTATLSVSDGTGLSGSTFDCVVSGTCSPTATSNTATLTVNSIPSVTGNPVNAVICSGSTTTYTVSATGTSLTYQWQVDQGSGFTNLTNTLPYSGVSTATLTITGATIGMDGYSYHCVVSGLCSPTATSSDATLTTSEAVNPVISNCPSNITLSAAAGTCGATTTWTAPTANDNCSVASFNSSHNSGSIFLVGMTAVTYTATDVSGNTATCTFTVTITDNENPGIANCPSNITLSAAAGTCGATATWTAPSPNDNCSIASFNSSHTSGSTFAVGMTAVTYTATDVSGNKKTCTFTVTVTDNEKPSFSACPKDTNISAGVFTYTSPTGSDNCPNFSINRVGGLGSGATFPAGTTTEVWVITDASGNTDTCRFKVIATSVFITEKEPGSGWNVYPNPASSQLTILSEKEITGTVSAELSDFLGRTVKKTECTLTNGKGTLETREIREGMYILSITNENIRFTKTIQISR